MRKGGAAVAQIGAAAVCAVIAGIVAVGYIKGLPVFDLFIEGAAQGLKTAVKLLPTLVGLWPRPVSACLEAFPAARIRLWRSCWPARCVR